MMSPCKQCLNNTWDFKKIENWIRATCKICGYEVEFSIKEKPRVEKEGDKCRHCGTPVILKASKFKENKLRKPYYYTHTLRCPKCKAIYLRDEYKVSKPPIDLKTATLKVYDDGSLQVVPAETLEVKAQALLWDRPETPKEKRRRKKELRAKRLELYGVKP